MTDTPTPRHEARTTSLLREAFARGKRTTLGEFLDLFAERAYGVVLLVLALPNFIPVPIGIGGVMGALVVLVALQMLIGRRQPWLPARVRRASLDPARAERFVARVTPTLSRLERLCRPRLEALTHFPSHRFSGILLVALGVLLLLPIPFTNYLFGALLVIFGVALIERDGALLIVAWIASVVTIGALLSISHVAIDLVRSWF